MTFAFNLCNPKEKVSSLRLVINHKGKQYRKNIGISVRTADFKKQRTKDEGVNYRLRLIENALNERLDQFSTPEDIAAAIDAALAIKDGKNAPPQKKKEGEGKVKFWDYFAEWSERDTPSKKDRQLAYKRVSGIMGTRENWDGIDEAWHFRFVQKCNELGLSLNYQATLIAKVKTVLIEGYKLHLHASQEYKKFSYKWETADSVALTKEEVDRLWEADLTGRDAMARDLFILGVYTASRFQNYSRLTEGNIVDGRIQFVQPKTGDAVIIPLSPRVKAVLERNGGEAPRMTEQELGRRIKQICKALGGSFLDTYDMRRTEGGKIKIEKKAKWEKVSPHSARRSGATILHLLGVPDYQLQKITGHRTLQNLQKYLHLSGEDNARILAENPFFK